MVRQRVAIDARHLYAGLGTYACQLLRGIERQELPFDVVAITRKEFLSHLADMVKLEVRLLEAPLYSLRAQALLPLIARDCDLLHAIHYDLPILHSRKVIVTIHDLIHLTRSYVPHGPAWFYARAMLFLAARRAVHIITVSEYSKAQLVEALRIPPSRITVIYNGVGPQFRRLDRTEAWKTVCERVSLRPPYLLYVGSLKKHKNVDSLMEAFALLRQRKEFEHQLVIVGNDPSGKRDLLERWRRLGVSKHVAWIPQVSTEILCHVYAGADLLILPSFVEGFGLPVLEAMACGTPVVCSRASSLPEVAGDAAEFFDPRSVEDLARAIERVLSSPGLQETLRCKGLERARRFSWEECARRHYQLYWDWLQA